MKKQTIEPDTQPFRVDGDNVPKARLLYNNLVIESIDNRTINNQGPTHTQISKESIYYDETETNSYSFEEMKHGQNILSSH